MTKKSSSVTIREVAREAGVSVATVSRFLNRNTPVSPEVAERLEKVMAQLKYVPHSAARQLATHRTNAIGLLLTSIYNDFFAPLLSGVEEVASRQGFNLLVATYRPDLLREELPTPIGPHNTDGMLVFVDSLKDELLIKLYRQGYPLVLIHRTPPKDIEIPFVTVENKDAARRLVSHLIESHNRTRILFLRGPANQEDSFWREEGYKEALLAHDLPYDESHILAGEFDRKIAYESVAAHMAQKGADFDAIFAGDDESAIGALTALKDAGKRVPEDIAVVGFDDQRMTPYLTPPLTTVRAPTEEVGREAARRLVALIRGQEVEAFKLLPTEIVYRRSCGCKE